MLIKRASSLAASIARDCPRRGLSLIYRPGGRCLLLYTSGFCLAGTLVLPQRGKTALGSAASLSLRCRRGEPCPLLASTPRSKPSQATRWVTCVFRIRPPDSLLLKLHGLCLERTITPRSLVIYGGRGKRRPWSLKREKRQVHLISIRRSKSSP
jgi:hypothetical protein